MALSGSPKDRKSHSTATAVSSTAAGPATAPTPARAEIDFKLIVGGPVIKGVSISSATLFPAKKSKCPTLVELIHSKLLSAEGVKELKKINTKEEVFDAAEAALITHLLKLVDDGKMEEAKQMLDQSPKLPNGNSLLYKSAKSGLAKLLAQEVTRFELAKNQMGSIDTPEISLKILNILSFIKILNLDIHYRPSLVGEIRDLLIQMEWMFPPGYFETKRLEAISLANNIISGVSSSAKTHGPA